MRRVLLRAFAVAILIIGAWSVGLAQGDRPAFELTVTSGTGFATVKCASGCLLTYLNEAGRATASNVYLLECKDGKPCQSPPVHGALQP